MNPIIQRLKPWTQPQWAALAASIWLSAAGSGAGQEVLTRPPSASVTPTPAPEVQAQSAFTPSVYRSFAEWKAACDRLPSNRALRQRLPGRELLPLKSFAQFAEVLNGYFKQCKESALAQKSSWLGAQPAPAQFFNTDAAYFLEPAIPFQPFVQRELVPAGTQLLFHGDLHGDIHSLVAWVDWLNQKGYLRDFHVIRPDVYLVFLGDYTDRGMYGIEVLYTMLRLKLENPTRVLMVRGNHEDVSLASRYGFIAEGRGKYGRDFDARAVMRLYDFLPLALYIGSGGNVLQCNHGGMEPGFNPGPLLDAPEGAKFQLLGRLNQQQFLKENPQMASSLPAPTRRLMQSSLLDFVPDSPTLPAVIGFMWNDFSVVPGEPQFDFDPARAYVYGESTTKLILRRSSGATRQIQAVFRAHQHATIPNSMMRRLKTAHGIYRHWQATDSLGLLEADLPLLEGKIEAAPQRAIPPLSVWTFNVAPDSVYGEACNFSFDTFGIVTTAAAFPDWKLSVVNQTIPK